MDLNRSDKIRRLADGSMDIAFYAARGHKLRSRAAHRGLRTIGRALGRLWNAPLRFGRRVAAALRRWRKPVPPQSSLGVAAGRVG